VVDQLVLQIAEWPIKGVSFEFLFEDQLCLVAHALN
jgi:hypothetical protein